MCWLSLTPVGDIVFWDRRTKQTQSNSNHRTKNRTATLNIRALKRSESNHARSTQAEADEVCPLSLFEYKFKSGQRDLTILKHDFDRTAEKEWFNDTLMELGVK